MTSTSLFAKLDIHDQWETTYRTTETADFYERVFDKLATIFVTAPGAVVLDSGCGTCAHAVRLARRGFRVLAVDLSSAVLEQAQARIQADGLESRIQLQRQDLCSLSFSDASIEHILCWGVLMHIPQVEQAVSELARVLKPGGMLVVGEGNLHSLEGLMRRFLRPQGHHGKGEVRYTAAGREYWKHTPHGTLLTRDANIPWLIQQLTQRGFVLRRRVAGQFTELYTKASSTLVRRMIHGFNRLWFQYVRSPHFAFGNILIFQKAAANDGNHLHP